MVANRMVELEWFLDTTVMFHCTSNHSLLRNFQAYEIPYVLRLENGRAVSVTCCGSLQTERLKLHEVHYVPDLKVNLISMYQLAKCGYELQINSGLCYVKHAKTGEVIGWGHNKCGIFVIENLIIDQIFSMDSVTQEDGEDELKKSSKTRANRFALLPVSRAHKFHEEQNKSMEWVLDMSASFHCTSDPSLLHCYYQHLVGANSPQHVCISDGSILPILGRGSVQTELFKFSDVHYIPGIIGNSISVSMLNQSGYDVHFTWGHCYVRDVRTGCIVGKGIQCRNMYILDYLILDQGRNWTQDELRGIRPYSHATPPADTFTDEDEEPTDRKPEMFGNPLQLSRWRTNCAHIMTHGLGHPQEISPSTVNQQTTNWFIVDSGSCFNITKDGSLLEPYDHEVMSPIEHIIGVSGANLPVTQVGYIQCAEVRLDGVLCVPNAVGNLVSIGQLQCQYPKLQVTFTAEGGVIFLEPSCVRGRMRKIGRARKEGNLFVLESFQPGRQYVDNLLRSVEESSGIPVPMVE